MITQLLYHKDYKQPGVPSTVYKNNSQLTYFKKNNTYIHNILRLGL